ncbi:hypothetical protein [Treponema phagedenis]|uniref:hypothetical protein n=1 Tax=Treponema phagedenis TaxID=162 RepID=UPI0021CC4F07|nr:hypothetical protein [Treponema phagedenis]
MYKPVDPKVNFAKQEEDVLKFWKEHGTFQKSIDQRKGAKEYVFLMGPLLQPDCRISDICAEYD